eukprot:7296796-Prorocentrum_lima.AAC.1
MADIISFGEHASSGKLGGLRVHFACKDGHSNFLGFPPCTALTWPCFFRVWMQHSNQNGHFAWSDIGRGT